LVADLRRENDGRDRFRYLDEPRSAVLPNQRGARLVCAPAQNASSLEQIAVAAELLRTLGRRYARSHHFIA
jgi:hypothetical protein